MTRDAIMFTFGAMVVAVIVMGFSGDRNEELTCIVSQPVKLPERGINGTLEWNEFVRETFSAELCR